MANQTFVNTQTREKEIKKIFFNITYNPTAPTATLATTTPIALSKVALNSLLNGATFTTQVAPAAANPTLTVLAVWTGSAAATVLTITPNDGTNNPTTQAFGSLATTTPIVLTKVVGARPGVVGNGDTFTTEVLVAAPNPTLTILAAFTGTAAATVCTITPNDGTNNAATPVDLTTAELAELITTGAVVGKTVTITDVGNLRNDQTATGGGAAVLVNAGEGDSITASFAGGVNTAVTLTTAELAELITTDAVVGKTVTVTDASGLKALVTATGGGAAPMVDAGEGDGKIATFAGGNDFDINNAVGFTSFALTATGKFRARLDDKWVALRGANFMLIDSTARDFTFQIAAYDMNPSGANAYVDVFTKTGATATALVAGSKVMGSLDLKNTSQVI